MALILDSMIMIMSIDPINLFLIIFFLFYLYFLLRRAVAAFINVVDHLLFQKHPIKMVKKTEKNVDEKNSATKETSIQYHTFGKPDRATKWRHQSCKIALFSQNIKTQVRPRLSTADKISSSCSQLSLKSVCSRVFGTLNLSVM